MIRTIKNISNLLWSVAAILLLSIAACSDSGEQYADKFTQLDPTWVVTADEGYEWALVKDANLPALTGSPEWLIYMRFLEQKLLEYGVVDVFMNTWDFERWDTSDDSSDWSLVSDGDSVRVANYGAYSGKLFANTGNTVSVPGYAVSKFRISHEFARGNWTLRPYLGINNIFDENYNSNIRINAFGGRFFEPAPTRNLYAGIVIRFE